MPAEEFDLIVLGAGPAGETVASRLAQRGLKAALIEEELVGGECAYWACIPSKTLLRPPEVVGEAERAPGVTKPQTRFDEIAKYRDYMVRDLDDSNQVKEYEEAGISVFRGRGALRGPGEVEVVRGQGEATAPEHVLRSQRIVIATGSKPAIPPIDGLDRAGYWTNREATTLKQVPDSAIVLGGGPVGIELAQMLNGFGARITLVEGADRLLAREDPGVGELLNETLRSDGIEVHLGVSAKSASASSGLKTITLDDGTELGASELILATGRKPRVDDLGLENVGLRPGKRGLEVDERCRAGEGIWAVGDVTGQMPFTHAAMYQGRIVVADISAEYAKADLTAVPRVVFSNPEVAAVGMTDEQAREAGIPAVAQRIKLGEAIARPVTYERDPRGELSILVDTQRKVLIGAWAVAPLASEWIHYAALAIKAQLPISMLLDTVAQFPTYTEAYLKALEKLEL